MSWAAIFAFGLTLTLLGIDHLKSTDGGTWWYGLPTLLEGLLLLLGTVYFGVKAVGNALTLWLVIGQCRHGRRSSFHIGRFMRQALVGAKSDQVLDSEEDDDIEEESDFFNQK